MKKVLKGILIGLGVMVVLGIGSSMLVGGAVVNEVAKETAKLEDQKSKIKINEIQLVNGEYGKTVQGKIINTTGEKLDYIELDVSFYDSEGAKIGETFINTTDLEKGETWKFDTQYAEEQTTEIKAEIKLNPLD